MCPRGGEGEDGAPSRCQLLSPLLPPPEVDFVLGPELLGAGGGGGKQALWAGTGRVPTYSWENRLGSGAELGFRGDPGGQTQSTLEGRVGGRQNEASRGDIRGQQKRRDPAGGAVPGDSGVMRLGVSTKSLRTFEPLGLLRSAARREPRALCFLCPKPKPP